MPFKSKRQWRWAFATKQSFARRWARKNKKAGGQAKFKNLPSKKGKAK